MRTRKECYNLIRDNILSHGFKVFYHHPMVSPDQTPHLDPRNGEGSEAHDCMFMLRMERRLGKEKGVIELVFTGCARMSGGHYDAPTLMRMAREMRDGARLVKALNDLELMYIDKEYTKHDSWRKKYV